MFGLMRKSTFIRLMDEEIKYQVGIVQRDIENKYNRLDLRYYDAGKKISSLEESVREKSNELEEKDRNIRSLVDWMGTMIGIDCSLGVTFNYYGFTISVLPSSYSALKFPKVEYVYNCARGYTEKCLRVNLTDNPVLNDVFKNELLKLNWGVKIYDNCVTIQRDTHFVEEVVEIYRKSLEKYNKLITK